MEDPSSAFDTYLTLDPDLSPSELQAEFDRLVQRQQAIALLLEGKAPIDYVEAMLYEHGIDPYEWAETAEQNLIYLLDTSLCPGSL